MTEDADAQLASLMQFLYSCPIGLIDFDPNGEIGLINPKAMQMMQTVAPATLCMNVFTLFEHCGPELRNLAQTFAPRRGTVCEQKRIFVHGGHGPGQSDATVFECTMLKLSDARYLATLTDVSRQVAQELQLKQAEVWFSSLVECADDFDVLSLDASGRVDGVSDAYLEKTGLPREGVIGNFPDSFPTEGAGESGGGIAGILDQARRDGWHLDESWHQTMGKDGRWCQRLVVVRHVGDIDALLPPDASTGYVLVLRPMSGRRFDVARLRHMLQNDFLTGAYNRAYFYEAAERDLKQATRRDTALSLIMLDIDRFKTINDTHGHGVGDEVLKAIASICQATVQKQGIFARLGGEEFGVLMMVDLETSCHMAERMRQAIADTAIATASGAIHVTASFGCSQLTVAMRSLHSLLNDADAELYKAKREGRNRVSSKLSTSNQPNLQPVQLMDRS